MEEKKKSGKRKVQWQKTKTGLERDKCRYTAKSYILNQNWNQSDSDLYSETQRNLFATGLIPNCKSYLQLCISSTKTALRHAIHTGLIQICVY